MSFYLTLDGVYFVGWNLLAGKLSFSYVLMLRIIFLMTVLSGFSWLEYKFVVGVLLAKHSVG